MGRVLGRGRKRLLTLACSGCLTQSTPTCPKVSCFLGVGRKWALRGLHHLSAPCRGPRPGTGEGGMKCDSLGSLGLPGRGKEEACKSEQRSPILEVALSLESDHCTMAATVGKLVPGWGQGGALWFEDRLHKPAGADPSRRRGELMHPLVPPRCPTCLCWAVCLAIQRTEYLNLTWFTLFYPSVCPLAQHSLENLFSQTHHH